LGVWITGPVDLRIRHGRVFWCLYPYWSFLINYFASWWRESGAVPLGSPGKHDGTVEPRRLDLTPFPRAVGLGDADVSQLVEWARSEQHRNYRWRLAAR
jgi:GNAT superfamily N-acetyltransferase